MSLRIAPVLLLAAGCGTNQFEAEAALEKKAVPLARETVEGGYALVTADELAQRLATQEALLLIDAMPAADFAREHLPGARNFEFPREPMTSWDAARTGGKSEQDYAALLGPDPGRTIVLYCGFVACTRSHNAALWAARLGFRDVLRFPGGIQAWKGSGRPVEEE
jgi:rhodanese-related sulfurtransferase